MNITRITNWLTIWLNNSGIILLGIKIILSRTNDITEKSM